MVRGDRPLRIAVVGSGPSGFYAAEALLAGGASTQVDMFEALPAPFGLVRYGVAPDHPKIKNIIARYEKTAGHPGFALFGNVEVGRDISVMELRRFYDAVVFASGAQTDRRLGIPGEDLPGSYTATEFVAWYNGHPAYRDHNFDLSHECAVVIGQGNVAMDVARILAKTVDELKHTDIAAHALDVLADSKVREVRMVGRRGPVQAAFTPPELKELGELADCDVLVDPVELELNAASRAELEELKWRDAIKNYELLKNLAARAPAGKSRRLMIQFYRGPQQLQGASHLESVLMERNELTGDAGRQKARGTGVTETVRCGVLFRSVGYRGVPIDGIPFDDRSGVFANLEGRITRDGKAVPGLYVAGWIKRGPSGIIGTNKPDSFETVKHVLADIPALPACEEPSRDAVSALLAERGVRVVSYEDWRCIDAAEVARGAAVGKPREKFVRVDEMLAVLEGR
ncbi:MAG: FAD-dependent oxidoreductase [Candidatus Krumholzibacteria bacterium]|nr:FAD-dependent oxidoreductase [Candidatus Krumholzibacteria bacterium]MDH4336122.1 FAD-dependent oxidoreductase [Candidatus Krumholzibacteria bacterium]MDH5268763.1 FAD-dependent oxidoreductase [Candidatus Krumholzibacteria bacterium]